MNRWPLTLLLLAPFGCDDAGSPAAGEERGPCYPNQTCNEGLVCASERCVDLYGSDDDEEGSPETGWEPESESEGESGPPELTCADRLFACPNPGGAGCISLYVDCSQDDGVPACEAFNTGCDLIGWSYAECAMGSEAQAVYCGEPGTTGEPDTYGSSDAGSGGWEPDPWGSDGTG